MKLKVMQRLYLREATATLALARFAVHFVPAAWLMAWARWPPRRINRFAGHDVGWIKWAIDVVGDKRWMQAKCLPRALAAQAMLRRRGIASKLCLGVARENGALSAHAWIELGQEIVVGAEQAPHYTRLLELGGERA